MKRKKYNKLVRDKIVRDLQQRGLRPKFRIARGPERLDKLKDKLLEETTELLEAANSYIISEENEANLIEETGDFLEVLDRILRYRGEGKISPVGSKLKLVLSVMKKKAKEKGRFEKEIILEEV
jgi:predicted house-cleaning noncanonical NTP pyrophosphatase (MazG superfamily)